MAAVNEERLNRKKMCWGFPTLSIAEVLRSQACRLADVDGIAVAGVDLFWRPEPVTVEDISGRTRAVPTETAARRGCQALHGRGRIRPGPGCLPGLKVAADTRAACAFKAALRDRQGLTAPRQVLRPPPLSCRIRLLHVGFDEATVITQDGAATENARACMQSTAAVSRRFHGARQLRFDRELLRLRHAPVRLQEHKHEGKITGLAAYGNRKHREILERFIRYDAGRCATSGTLFGTGAIQKLRGPCRANCRREDLAASIQLLSEDIGAPVRAHWARADRTGAIALAGGVVANVKINQRIHELRLVEKVFVYPAMSDEGLAVGAALLRRRPRVRGAQPRAMLRRRLPRPRVQREARWRRRSSGVASSSRAGATCPRRVARLIADGYVVARCAGRMEYGPRALGNRTILYRPTNRRRTTG